MPSIIVNGPASDDLELAIAAGSPREASANQGVLTRALQAGGYVQLLDDGVYHVTSDNFAYPEGTIFYAAPNVRFAINGVERELHSLRPIRGGPQKDVLTMSWVDRPQPYAYQYRQIYFQDVGVNGSLWWSDGTRWIPASGAPIVLATQNYAADDCLDSGTGEVFMFRYTVPPFLMAENFALQLYCKASWPGSTATKNLRAYIGAAQVAVVNSGGSASVLGTRWDGITISNQNNIASQLGEAASVAGATSQQTANNQTATANMATYRDVSIRANWSATGTGTNRITLQWARLELVCGL